jgi:hypothetical protein
MEKAGDGAVLPVGNPCCSGLYQARYFRLPDTPSLAQGCFLRVCVPLALPSPPPMPPAIPFSHTSGSGLAPGQWPARTHV